MRDDAADADENEVQPARCGRLPTHRGFKLATKNSGGWSKRCECYINDSNFARQGCHRKRHAHLQQRQRAQQRHRQQRNGSRVDQSVERCWELVTAALVNTTKHDVNVIVGEALTWSATETFLLNTVFLLYQISPHSTVVLFNATWNVTFIAPLFSEKRLQSFQTPS
jgi:hypothetical protein